MSQSLAVSTPIVPGRTFLFPGVVGLVHVVASLLAVLALCSPLRDLLGLGKEVTSLVPLVCSNLIDWLVCSFDLQSRPFLVKDLESLAS